jgi:release factor glutamine methyltransferase
VRAVPAATLRHALARATTALARAAVPSDSPRLDAEVLLRHVLGVTRAALYASPEHPLSAAQAAAYRALLRRRAAGEPVAYLTGHREFMGLDFAVDARVLVPRPETETLVERVLALLAAPPRGWPAAPLVADVGTGSGAIAVSVAALAPTARVVATDTSAGALAVARDNAARLLARYTDRTAARVWLVRCHLLTAVRGPIHVVAANLPYIPTGAMGLLPVTVRDFEPRTALDGGGDGLDAYRVLLEQLPSRLAAGGRLLMECDPEQAPLLAALAARALPGATVTAVNDLRGAARVVDVRR